MIRRPPRLNAACFATVETLTLERDRYKYEPTNQSRAFEKACASQPFVLKEKKKKGDEMHMVTFHLEEDNILKFI